MPIVSVLGLPEDIDLEELSDEIKAAIAGQLELNLSPKDITVYDCSTPALAEKQKEVTLFMDLYRAPERTSEVLGMACIKAAQKVLIYLKDVGCEGWSCGCYPRFLEKGAYVKSE